MDNAAWRCSPTSQSIPVWAPMGPLFICRIFTFPMWIKFSWLLESSHHRVPSFALLSCIRNLTSSSCFVGLSQLNVTFIRIPCPCHCWDVANSLLDRGVEDHPDRDLTVHLGPSGLYGFPPLPPGPTVSNTSHSPTVHNIWRRWSSTYSGLVPGTALATCEFKYSVTVAGTDAL